MSTAHERKKQPEVVRQALIDCAARLAVDRGLHAVTVQAVSDAAGVTKGGLFHHFPNKEKLIEAVFQDKLMSFEVALNEALEADGKTYGCFTRAYVIATLQMDETRSQFGALCVAMMMDPVFRQDGRSGCAHAFPSTRRLMPSPLSRSSATPPTASGSRTLRELAPDLRMDRTKLMSRLVAMTQEGLDRRL